MQVVEITGVGKEAKALKGGPKKGKIVTWMKGSDDRNWGILGDHTGNWQDFKGKTISVNIVQEHDQFPIAELADTPESSASPAVVQQGAAKVRPRPSLSEYEAFLTGVVGRLAKNPLTSALDPNAVAKLATHIGMAYLQGDVVPEPEATPEDAEQVFAGGEPAPF